MRLLPFIVYLDTYVRSPAGQRLLAGLPLETVAVPKALCATPEEVSAQRVARDDEIMPEGETSYVTCPSVSKSASTILIGIPRNEGTALPSTSV